MKHGKIAMTFKTKLICGIMGILVLNTVLTGVMYYDYAYQDTIDNYYQTSENLLKQMSLYLESHISEITTKVNALNNNLAFSGTIKEYIVNIDSAAYGKQLSDIADFLSQLESSDKLIDSVYLYTEYGDFDNFVKTRNRQFVFRESFLYSYFLSQTVPDVGYFAATQDYVFRTAYPVIPIVYNRRIGNTRVFYCVALDTRVIQDYLNDNYAMFDGIYITSEKGDIIDLWRDIEPSSVQKIKKEDLRGDKSRLRSGEYVLLQENVPLTKWNVCAVKNRGTLTDNLASLRWAVMAQLTLVACMVFVLGMFLTNAMTVPLIRLADMMEKASSNQFSMRFSYHKKDEIGKLTDSFNFMSDEINHLVAALNDKIEELEQEKHHVREEQEKKRLAELRALQAQINPHFLYNTLNTISWQAASQGAMEACEISNLLGKFFRNSLSKGKEYVTVREEEEQVVSYLEIQKVRYQTKLDFKVEIALDIKPCYMVHLVLQPLVENAIYHGIKEVERPGFISISGWKERRGQKEYMLFAVEDNGLGIPKEQLEKLNKNLSRGIVDSNTGYGIYNVNERIRLSHGTEYGLVLESEYGAGTRSVLLLPVVNENLNYTDRKEDDVNA